jgi:hypothetical protein
MAAEKNYNLCEKYVNRMMDEIQYLKYTYKNVRICGKTGESIFSNENYIQTLQIIIIFQNSLIS